MQLSYCCAFVAAIVLWLGTGPEALTAPDLTYIAASDARVTAAGEWQQLEGDVPGLSFAGWWQSDKPGDSLSLRVQDKSVAVVILSHAAGGHAEIVVDGAVVRTVDMFGIGAPVGSGYLDAPSVNPRQIIALDQPQPGEHVVTVRVVGVASNPLGRKGEKIVGGPTGFAVSVAGFITSDKPLRSVAGRVADATGLPIPRAALQFEGAELPLEAAAGDDGIFAWALPLGSGQITAQAPDYQPATTAVPAGEAQAVEIVLAEADSHPLAHTIYRPTETSPLFVRPGDALEVELIDPESNGQYTAELVDAVYPTEERALGVAGAVNNGFGRVTLRVDVPPDLPEGLYDLHVGGDVQFPVRRRAVSVREQWPEDYAFVALDSIESDLKTLRAMAREINIMNPAFVLITGDNINNPKSHDVGIRKFERLLAGLNEFTVPTAMVPGNHDLSTWGEPGPIHWYRQVFGPDRFTFSFGADRYIGLNSGCYQKVHIEQFDPTQISWYKQFLRQADDETLKVAFRHIVYANYTWCPQWERELGADLVVYGHCAQDKVEHKGNTVYAQTADVAHRIGAMRWITVRDHQAPPQVNTAYWRGIRPGRAPSLRYNRISVFQRPVEGRPKTCLVEVHNQHAQDFPDARIRLQLPPGTYGIRGEGVRILRQVARDDETALEIAVVLPAAQWQRFVVGPDAQALPNIPAVREFHQAGPANEALPASLVCRFSFDQDELAAPADVSGQDNSVYLCSGRIVPGRGGGVLQLREELLEACMIRRSSALYLPDEMTVALWVKPTDKGETGILVSAGGSGSTLHVTYQWELALESGKVRFTTSPDGVERVTVKSPEVIPGNVWTYIAAAYDPLLGNRISINGQEVARKQAEGGLNVLPVERQQPVCLGIDPARYFRSYYDGLLDEVMIFSRALPAEQIGSLYQATVVDAAGQ